MLLRGELQGEAVKNTYDILFSMNWYLHYLVQMRGITSIGELLRKKAELGSN